MSEQKLATLQADALTVCIAFIHTYEKELTQWNDRSYDSIYSKNKYSLRYEESCSSRVNQPVWFMNFTGPGFRIAIWEKTQKQCLLSLCKATLALSDVYVDFQDTNNSIKCLRLSYGIIEGNPGYIQA